MSNYADGVKEVFDNALCKIDVLTSKEVDRITCKDLYDAYFKGIYDIKKAHSGNAAGVTGFSEYFLLRILSESIGERYSRVPMNESPSKDDISKVFDDRSKHYIVETSTTKINEDRKIKPDIIVKSIDGDTLLIIEVKTSLVSAKKDLEKFESNYSYSMRQNIPVLLVSYWRFSGPATKILDEMKKKYKGHLHTLDLESGKNTIIADVFRELLK
jgi:hypothetical protein